MVKTSSWTMLNVLEFKKKIQVGFSENIKFICHSKKNNKKKTHTHLQKGQFIAGIHLEKLL